MRPKTPNALAFVFLTLAILSACNSNKSSFQPTYLGEGVESDSPYVDDCPNEEAPPWITKQGSDEVRKTMSRLLLENWCATLAWGELNDAGRMHYESEEMRKAFTEYCLTLREFFAFADIYPDTVDPDKLAEELGGRQSWEDNFENNCEAPDTPRPIEEFESQQ
jgi:hypothetical protein